MKSYECLKDGLTTALSTACAIVMMLGLAVTHSISRPTNGFRSSLQVGLVHFRCAKKISERTTAESIIFEDVSETKQDLFTDLASFPIKILLFTDIDSNSPVSVLLRRMILSPHIPLQFENYNHIHSCISPPQSNA